jgi:hypothetical protein
MQTQPASTDAADIAARSGLFGAAPAPTAEKTTDRKPQPRQKAKIPAKGTATGNPCDSTGVKSAQKPVKRPVSEVLGDQHDISEIPVNPTINGLDLLDNRSVYGAIRSTIGMDSKAAFAVANCFVLAAKRLVKMERQAVAGDRYSGVEQADGPNGVRAREQAPPTREELIGIVSAALRAENATGSDVKGLTATLESLLPELFNHAGVQIKPDPALFLGYLLHLDGCTTDELMAEIGGPEFVAGKLSEILKTPVKLG